MAIITEAQWTQAEALADKAGPPTPDGWQDVRGLTVNAAAIVLGIYGAKSRAYSFWQRSAVDREVTRLRQFAATEVSND